MESIVIASRSDSSHFTHPYVHVTSKAVDNWFKVKTGMTTTQCAAALESFATADLSGELVTTVRHLHTTHSLADLLLDAHQETKDLRKAVAKIALEKLREWQINYIDRVSLTDEQ